MLLQWLSLAAASPAATSSSNSTSDLFTVGGIITAVITALGMYARTQIKREQDRADRYETINKELNELIRDQYVAGLKDASHTMQEVVLVLADIKKEREIERLLAERESQRGDRDR